MSVKKRKAVESEWKMIKGRIEGAVREGKMSREQANENMSGSSAACIVGIRLPARPTKE